MEYDYFNFLESEQGEKRMKVEYEDNDLEGIKKVVYFPTDLDKQIMSGLCTEIINILEPLRIEQKAFVLAQLVSSFSDVSGINMEEVFTSYKDSHKPSQEKQK